ncbi:MAG: hypothetical protein NTV96_01890, partial [Actinobacteria bacterium]|nr:hypothetical protein [Actinomycetota bacterium]
ADEPIATPSVAADDEPAKTIAAQLSISVDTGIGSPTSGSRVSVKASGLLPGSRATLFIFSTPRVIGEAIADADGFLSMSVALPSDLAAGEQTLILEAEDSKGHPIQQATNVSISAAGTIAATAENSSTAGLEIPVISYNPKVPPYPVVVPLDAPAAVVATSSKCWARRFTSWVFPRCTSWG